MSSKTNGSEPPKENGLVSQWLDYSKDFPSPKVFRLWAILHAIGAAAERRVWTQSLANQIFPNLYVLLVGPPGTGKSQAINPVTGILRKSQAVAIAPNDMTKQGLLDTLAEASKAVIINGQPFDYHFLAICISELSNFMSKFDDALAGILTDLYDCLDANEERKRSGAGAMIPFPGLSFIMGSATRNLGQTIGENRWGTGFMARIIMVYSANKIIPEDMFADAKANEPLKERIALGLRRIGEMKGQMLWHNDARVLMRDFRANDTNGPLHNRLEEYSTRRWFHLCKLCMISALSEQRLLVEASDFHAASSWLLDAEADMTEIFKDMVSHSDGAIHEELRNYLFAVYVKERAPLHASIIYHYLKDKVATHSIEPIIAIAQSAGYLKRAAGSPEGDEALYIPQGPMGSRNYGVL